MAKDVRNRAGEVLASSIHLELLQGIPELEQKVVQAVGFRARRDDFEPVAESDRLQPGGDDAHPVKQIVDVDLATGV